MKRISIANDTVSHELRRVPRKPSGFEIAACELLEFSALPARGNRFG